MIIKYLYRLIVAITLCVSFNASSASLLVPDAGWYCFGFLGVGSPAFDGGPGYCAGTSYVGTAGNTMTFDLTNPAQLKVTDAGTPGDVFDVYVNSVLAFTTSAPGTGNSTSNPDFAYASNYFSSGNMLLGSGSYAIDIFAAASPFGQGAAFIEVESTVIPIPAAVWLFVTGLLGLIGISGRK